METNGTAGDSFQSSGWITVQNQGNTRRQGDQYLFCSHPPSYRHGQGQGLSAKEVSGEFFGHVNARRIQKVSGG